MTPEEFVYWIQGGRELGAFKDGISKEQAAVIFEHLDLVFTKVTTKTVEPVAKVVDTRPKSGTGNPPVYDWHNTCGAQVDYSPGQVFCCGTFPSPSLDKLPKFVVDSMPIDAQSPPAVQGVTVDPGSMTKEEIEKTVERLQLPEEQAKIKKVMEDLRKDFIRENRGVRDYWHGYGTQRYC